MEALPDDSAPPELFTSVWEGSDGDLLEVMFNFYKSIPVEPILDATYNEGRFWRGSARQVDGMDILDFPGIKYVTDNREMSGVPSDYYGCVVYDPPHVGNQGRSKSCKQFDVKYGATIECLSGQGYTMSFLYPPFLLQARRVLRRDGLLLAKITDQVNNHRSRYAHCDFIRMAEEVGFTACDIIIKIRRGPMMSSKWRTQHHARKRHSYWIVCRNGSSCER